MLSISRPMSVHRTFLQAFMVFYSNYSSSRILKNAGDDVQDLQASEDGENSWSAHTFHASEIPAESTNVKED
ncbi:hypothetical protein FGIG_08640, partial [Fasciola gigantica]